jgi:hypothetical protein
VYPVELLKFEVRRILINNVIEDTPVLVSVDRDVHTDFDGRVRIEIRKANVDGEFFSYCTRYVDEVPFRRGTFGPERDLNTLMRIPPNPDCHLTEGQYYGIFTFYIPIIGGIAETRLIEQSNTFMVVPPAAIQKPAIAIIPSIQDQE